MNNPLLQKWDTPFETPPFTLILTSHYKPAAEETIKSATAEIQEITENPDGATFENTIASLDRAGENLGRISSILFNLNSAETSRELQLIAQEISLPCSHVSQTILL